VAVPEVKDVLVVKVAQAVKVRVAILSET